MTQAIPRMDGKRVKARLRIKRISQSVFGPCFNNPDIRRAYYFHKESVMRKHKRSKFTKNGIFKQSKRPGTSDFYEFRPYTVASCMIFTRPPASVNVHWLVNRYLEVPF
jgi:hypothetical protein